MVSGVQELMPNTVFVPHRFISCMKIVFDSNFAASCSQWSSLEYDSIGSDNGLGHLAPVWCQVIIWNIGIVYGHMAFCFEI